MIDLKAYYLNFFIPSTNICYQIGFTCQVNLTIYNALGQQIEILVNQEQNAGTYAVKFDAQGLANGVYYAIIRNGSQSLVRKMILLK